MDFSTRRTSISLPKEILMEGRRLAQMRRRNFSNYVADLIAADAEKHGNSFPFGKNADEDDVTAR